MESVSVSKVSLTILPKYVQPAHHCPMDFWSMEYVLFALEA
jgi:hypothetical protein